MSAITLNKAYGSTNLGRGRGDVHDRTSEACLRAGQPGTRRDDRGNAALEGKGILTPDPNEHHRDERVVSGPISWPFSYVYFAACNRACSASAIFRALACVKVVPCVGALPVGVSVRAPGRIS